MTSIPDFGTTWIAQNPQNKKTKQYNNNSEKTKNLFLLIKTYHQTTRRGIILQLHKP